MAILTKAIADFATSPLTTQFTLILPQRKNAPWYILTKYFDVVHVFYKKKTSEFFHTSTKSTRKKVPRNVTQALLSKAAPQSGGATAAADAGQVFL